MFVERVFRYLLAVRTPQSQKINDIIIFFFNVNTTCDDDEIHTRYECLYISVFSNMFINKSR